MGLFSNPGKSRDMGDRERREWAKEYDRRKDSGAKTRHMRWGEVQIQDDDGNWYRRNGDACCGCGRNAQHDHPKGHHVKPRWGRR